MRANEVEMLVARGKALPEDVRLAYVEHFAPGDAGRWKFADGTLCLGPVEALTFILEQEGG